METEFPDVFELNVTQKIELIDAIWDSIDFSQQPVPVSDETKAMLDKSIADFESAPQPGRPWREVIEELEQRYE
ncbi:MAG: addiction module protein [Candidatus Saccharimonas sp.]|nr:addiction module protein [Planctomycetaceae bacterium]